MTQRRLGSAGSSGAAKRGYDTEAVARLRPQPSPPPPCRTEGIGFSDSGRQEKPPNTCWRQDTLVARGRTPSPTSDFCLGRGTAALITRLSYIRMVARINRQSLVLVHLLSQCCCTTDTQKREDSAAQHHTNVSTQFKP